MDFPTGEHDQTREIYVTAWKYFIFKCVFFRQSTFLFFIEEIYGEILPIKNGITT
jgi:hypothetical protein